MLALAMVALALSQAPDAGDAASLSGQVRARGSRKPIPGASILGSDGGLLATADDDGRFSATLEPGPTSLRVRAPGFFDGAFHEELRPHEAVQVLYALMPREVSPYETVVRGERRVEVNRTSLGMEELQNAPGTAGDPFRALLLLPGVSNAMSGTAFPIVRGSEPTSTGYFLDGVQVPSLFHLYLGPSAVYPELIESIDFYPGGAPPPFGRLLEGAVDARVRDPGDALHANAYVDLLNLGGVVDVPFPSTGTNVTLAGRFSYSGALIEATNVINQALGEAGQTVLDFYDYQARVEQKLGPGRLRLFAFGSSDSSGTQTSDPLTDSVLQISFHRVDLRYRARLGPGEGELGLTWGVDRVTQVGAGGKNEDYVDIPELGYVDVATTYQSVWEPSYRARARWTGELARGLRLAVGGDVDHREADISATRVSVDPFGYSANLELPGAFGTFSGAWARLIWEPSERWRVAPGLRFDDYHLVPGMDRPVLEPRLSARFRATETVELTAAAGLYHQVPSSFVNLPAMDLAGMAYGLEEAWQFDTGVRWKPFGGAFELSLDGYFHWLPHTIDLSIDTRDAPVNCDPVAMPTSPCVVFPSLSATPSHGYAYGVELMARRALGRNWFGWLSLTLQRSMRWAQYQLVDASGAVTGEGSGYVPFAYDQTFVANAVLSHSFSNGWRTGVALHFNTGRPNSGSFPATNGVNEYLASYTYEVDPNGVIQRLPSFFRVDLRVSKTWLFQLFTLEAYLDVLNATASEEVLAIQQNADGTSSTIGSRLFLPVLGVKGAY